MEDRIQSSIYKWGVAVSTQNWCTDHWEVDVLRVLVLAP